MNFDWVVYLEADGQMLSVARGNESECKSFVNWFGFKTFAEFPDRGLLIVREEF